MLKSNLPLLAEENIRLTSESSLLKGRTMRIVSRDTEKKFFFRISFWNCRGWRSGQGAIENFLFESGTDVLGVCETFLDENSANRINISDFQFFHVSRNKKSKVA